MHDADVHRAVRWRAHALGDGRALVASREIERSVVVDLSLLRILQDRHGLKTLDGHAGAIPGDPASIRSNLSALARVGLLRRRVAPDAPASGITGRVPDHITTIAIATADRPTALRRTLESFTRHCDEYARRPRFLIVDGSQEPVTQTATRSIVDALAHGTGHHLTYVGPVEAAAVCDRLTASLPLPALRPGTTGASRNLLLLMTAGEQIVMVDDDIVCDTWAFADRQPGLAVTGHHEMRRAAFFANRAEALGAATRTNADLLAAHEALLARALDELLVAFQDPPDLTDACPHLLSALAERRHQVVKATFSGLAGDSGTYCPGRLLLGTGSIRDRLWSSAAMFSTAMASREVLRIAMRNMVTHDSHCMAYCMGLSNQSVVPPFAPVGRNEDGVFGALLAACTPDALFGHIPIGIVHDSDRSSPYRDRSMRSAGESRVSELLIVLARRLALATFATSSADRLRRIGVALADIGRSSSSDFIALVTEATLESRCREIAIASSAAATVECPPYWRDALDDYRNRFAEAASARGFFLPIEFQCGDDIDVGYRNLQAFISSFGDLIASWPALWEAARAQNPVC